MCLINNQILSTLVEYQYLQDIWFPRIYKSNLSLCLPGPLCLCLFAEGLEDSFTKTCRHLFPKPASTGVGHWKRWAPPGPQFLGNRTSFLLMSTLTGLSSWQLSSHRCWQTDGVVLVIFCVYNNTPYVYNSFLLESTFPRGSGCAQLPLLIVREGGIKSWTRTIFLFYVQEYLNSSPSLCWSPRIWATVSTCSCHQENK